MFATFLTLFVIRSKNLFSIDWRPQSCHNLYRGSEKSLSEKLEKKSALVCGFFQVFFGSPSVDWIKEMLPNIVFFSAFFGKSGSQFSCFSSKNNVCIFNTSAQTKKNFLQCKQSKFLKPSGVEFGHINNSSWSKRAVYTSASKLNTLTKTAVQFNAKYNLKIFFPQPRLIILMFSNLEIGQKQFGFVSNFMKLLLAINRHNEIELSYLILWRYHSHQKIHLTKAEYKCLARFFIQSIFGDRNNSF